MESSSNPGDDIHCPHCAQWHPLKTRGGEDAHPYVQKMLYFECGRGTYFAGTTGAEARFPVRPAKRSE
jgi:hypothetical protein